MIGLLGTILRPSPSPGDVWRDVPPNGRKLVILVFALLGLNAIVQTVRLRVRIRSERRARAEEQQRVSAARSKYGAHTERCEGRPPAAIDPKTITSTAFLLSIRKRKALDLSSLRFFRVGDITLFAKLPKTLKKTRRRRPYGLATPKTPDITFRCRLVPVPKRKIEGDAETPRAKDSYETRFLQLTPLWVDNATDASCSVELTWVFRDGDKRRLEVQLPANTIQKFRVPYGLVYLRATQGGKVLDDVCLRFDKTKPDLYTIRFNGHVFNLGRRGRFKILTSIYKWSPVSRSKRRRTR